MRCDFCFHIGHKDGVAMCTLYGCKTELGVEHEIDCDGYMVDRDRILSEVDKEDKE